MEFAGFPFRSVFDTAQVVSQRELSEFINTLCSHAGEAQDKQCFPRHNASLFDLSTPRNAESAPSKYDSVWEAICEATKVSEFTVCAGARVALAHAPRNPMHPENLYEALTAMDNAMLSRMVQRVLYSQDQKNERRLAVYVGRLGSDHNKRQFVTRMLAEFPTPLAAHGELLPQLLRMTWRTLTPLQLEDGLAQFMVHTKLKIKAAEDFVYALGQHPSVQWLEKTCAPFIQAVVNLQVLHDELVDGSGILDGMFAEGIVQGRMMEPSDPELLIVKALRKFFDDFDCERFLKTEVQNFGSQVAQEKARNMPFVGPWYSYLMSWGL
jgi:hypothetical protein